MKPIDLPEITLGENVLQFLTDSLVNGKLKLTAIGAGPENRARMLLEIEPRSSRFSTISGNLEIYGNFKLEPLEGDRYLLSTGESRAEKS